MKRKFYDRLAEVYEERYNDDLNQKMREEEKTLLLRYLKEGNVLDIGCGQGYHTTFLRNHGFDVYGLDISKNMIATGEVQNALVAEASHLPFTESSFDNIISIFGALNHTDIRSFSEELMRVLKPNGRFLFTVANALSFKRVIKIGVKKRGRVTLRLNEKMYSTKLHYYTPEDLTEIFEEFNIKIGSLYPRSTFLPVLRNFGHYLVVCGKKA